MRITMIDDSVAFDGASPAQRALGGPEKAFAGLAAALAARGHAVVAINRCEVTTEIDGVTWLPLATPPPPNTDILIASRKASLVADIDADIRLLWMWGPPRQLNQPANQTVLDKYRPTVVFVGDMQRRSWKSWRDFQESVISPGLAGDYLSPGAAVRSDVPTAIVTTHPLNGLQKIVRMWRERIHPAHESAELHIYSAALFRAGHGAALDPRFADVFDEVQEAAEDGVVICAPETDAGMAAAYRAAWLHLYPAAPEEAYCSTLAESQATGLPAIARRPASGGDALDERVRNGQTGYIVPDDDAFTNVTLEVLSNEQLRDTLSQDARTLQAGRSWQAAAIEFEALWATGQPS